MDFKIKFVDCNDRKVKLTIWDTAGQERFRTLTASYYRGAQGIILVYDVARRDTFESLEHWLNEVEIYGPSTGVVKVLVGNKADKKEERTVTREEGEEWAKERGMLFLESSAKTCVGITQVFMEVVEKIMESPELINRDRADRVTPLRAGAGAAQGGGCC